MSPDTSLPESSEIIVADTNGLSEDLVIDPKDLKALTLAISGIVEGIVRKVIDVKLDSLLQPLIEQSVKNLLPESLPLVTAELPKLAEEHLSALLPGLIEAALAGQQATIKESVEEVTRQSLPGMLGPIIERLTKDTLQPEIEKFLNSVGGAVLEKIAWEVVPSQAEIEIKKEIVRLSADA
jgi:hypothetical protein